MKSISLIILFFLVMQIGANAQSKTTEALHKNNSEALALFFYNNTLRMLNQKEDPEFDALIKDIEKMKLLMIDKKANVFDYKKLVSDYKAELFEEVMTSRYQGKNFDVYVKEKNGKTNGMLVLINDEKNLFVLDIVGSIALNQVTNFYKTLDESSDIAKKVKAFTGHGDEDNDNDDHHTGHH
jgi:hypothetical protein